MSAGPPPKEIETNIASLQVQSAGIAAGSADTAGTATTAMSARLSGIGAVPD